MLDPPRRQLNVKLAIILPVLVALFAGTVYGVHEYQVRETAREMKSRAVAANDSGDVDEAIRNYRYYLQYEKYDDEALAQLALLTAGRAKKTGGRALLEAYRLLERASVRKQDNLEVVRQMAEIGRTIGRNQEAADHYKRLIQEFPEESNLYVELGRCQIEAEREREAIASFQRAIAADGKNLDAYVALADLLRKIDDADGAEDVMTQMVTANPAMAKAYVKQGLYWKELGDTERAEAAIERARTMAPDDVDVLLAVAQMAVADEDMASAERALRRAKELYPGDNRVLLALGRVKALQGDPDVGGLFPPEGEQKQPTDLKTLVEKADLLIQVGDVEAARKVIEELERQGCLPAILDYFRARILVVQRKWREASEKLEALRTEVAGWPEVRSPVDMLLGVCYEQLGLPDRQLAVYERVLEEDPMSIPGRAGRALAYFRVGKIDEALADYRKLQKSLGTEEFLKVPALRTNLYQVLLARNAKLPEDQRDFTEIEELLVKMQEEDVADSLQGALMRAELLVKQGRMTEARALLTTRRDKDPQQVSVWVALANLAALEGNVDQGLQTLDDARKELGPDLRLAVGRVGMAMRLPPSAGKPILAGLEQTVDDLPEEQHAALWRALGAGYYKLLDRDKANEFWSRASEADPEDAKLQLILFELARENDDEEAMRDRAAKIGDTLGNRSAEYSYAEASRLLWMIRYRQMDRRRLADAKELLQIAADQRPTWHEIPRLEAEIALYEGREDDAVESLQRAHDLGPLNQVQLALLVRLLYGKGRYEEAKSVWDEMSPGQKPLGLEKIGPQLSAMTGDMPEALRRAEEVIADSDRASDYLWYGQLLAQAEKADEAEAAFRRAVELDPQLAPGYLALVTILQQQGKTSEARSVIRQAEIQLPEDRTSLVLGQCYQILGDQPSAEQYFLRALSIDPENLGLLRMIAEMYLRRSDGEGARKYLIQLVQQATKDPETHKSALVWGRRALAGVLASSGEYRQHVKAMALLEQNERLQGGSLEDMRLRAAILAARPERTARVQAIELLENIQAKKPTLDPEEQFLLARLYDQNDNWALCRDQMVELLGRYPRNARYLGTYVEMLLKNNDSTGDLSRRMAQLEDVQPDAPVTVGLKARVLKHEGRPEEAVALLQSLVPRPMPLDQVGRLLSIAKLLEEMELYGPAQETLDEYADKAPGGALALAAFLGRNGTAEEALDQCEAAMREVSTVNVLSTAVTALRHQGDQVREEDFARVNAWMDKAAAEDPGSLDVELERAKLFELEARYDDLEALYRGILQREELTDRNRAIVLNNLAYVLANQEGRGKDALEAIGQAIDILGPLPDLVDTRALAYQADGKIDKAIDEIRRSITDGPSGVKYFHLASAYMAKGDKEAAARALKVARENHGLRLEDVPRIERDKYKQLMIDISKP